MTNDPVLRVMSRLRTVLVAAMELPRDQRIVAYNAGIQALAALVADVSRDPAVAPRLVAIEDVEANDYNPNMVARPELALLRQSIEADGVTMAIVTVHDTARRKWIVVDGFHRHRAVAEMERTHIPCTVIDRPLADRMASTIRHNRARGKHQVELMGHLVRALRAQGWDDSRIATHLGMSAEELLRLLQTVGAAVMLAPPEYEQAWETADGDDDPARRSDHTQSRRSAGQRRRT